MKRCNDLVDDIDNCRRDLKRTRNELSIRDVVDVFSFNHYWEMRRKVSVCGKLGTQRPLHGERPDCAMPYRYFCYLDLDGDIDLPRIDLKQDLKLIDDMIIRCR